MLGSHSELHIRPVSGQVHQDSSDGSIGRGLLRTQLTSIFSIRQVFGWWSLPSSGILIQTSQLEELLQVRITGHNPSSSFSDHTLSLHMDKSVTCSEWTFKCQTQVLLQLSHDFPRSISWANRVEIIHMDFDGHLLALMVVQMRYFFASLKTKPSAQVIGNLVAELARCRPASVKLFVQLPGPFMAMDIFPFRWRVNVDLLIFIRMEECACDSLQSLPCTLAPWPRAHQGFDLCWQTSRPFQDPLI